MICKGSHRSRLRKGWLAVKSSGALPADNALLVTFARPEESRAFLRRLEEPEKASGKGPIAVRGRLGSLKLAVAYTGIGPDAATAAIGELMALQPWWLVIGAGFAGGLDPKLAVGDAVMEEARSDPPRRIVSVARPVESVAAKRALREKSGAAAVDMETESLWSVCRSRCIPFLAIRVISDPADVDLPVPFDAWFDLNRQQVRPLGLLGYLLRHPRSVPRFARFARSVPGISAALGLALEGAIRGIEAI